MIANINPDLKHLVRDIASLKQDPQNVRKHSLRNLQAIAASLSKYGQQKPIVASRGVVLAGNGTLEAALGLGWDKIAVTEFSGVGINRTGFALADNRTAELAEWDFEKLSDQLNLFENQMELTSLWSQEELNAMNAPSAAGDLGSTPDEKLRTFETNTIKQIVIYLEDAEYKDVLMRFRRIMEEKKLESSTDVVLLLLNNYDQKEIPVATN